MSCETDHRSSARTEATSTVSPSGDGSAWGFVLWNGHHLHFDLGELQLLKRGEEVTVQGIINAEYQRWVADHFRRVSALSRPE